MSLNGIKLWDVKWDVFTAGPSPDNNQRTEVFFLGCRKAMEGNPCKGCFNTTTHNDNIAEYTHDPIEMAAHLDKCAPNRYITIGGGEPTDQIDNLITLCKELKKYGFHIMVYTWRDLQKELSSNESDHADGSLKRKFEKLLGYIDILVDGEYKAEERMYNDDSESDGTFNSIGSGNQIVWDVRGYNKALWPQAMSIRPFMTGIALRDVVHLYLRKHDELGYILKDDTYHEYKVYL